MINITKLLGVAFIAFNICQFSYAKDYYVSQANGKNDNDGSLSKPFKTIQKAADIAIAGDNVIVRNGVYRERIDPKNGGTSDSDRITYMAFKGEHPVVKGSEVVSNWTKEGDSTWKAVVDNKIFSGGNPFQIKVAGDWFNSLEETHFIADVYINGNSLYGVSSREKVLDLNLSISKINKGKTNLRWFAEVGDKYTTINATFGDLNPNKNLVEISARTTCFYPSKEGVNYITIRGFEFEHAATQWAAPTAIQIGMVSTNWNKGWIIENNKIHDTKANGITLGKDVESGDNVWSKNKTKDGSVHYIEVTFKALRNGWNKEKIGSHIVRNNEIYNCEQTGICGSFGAAFSTIEHNYIHDVWVKRQFQGAEIAGIKFHAAVDAIIQKNLVINCGKGIWLDWMTQGTLVCDNIFMKNDVRDIYLEVNHGPFIIYNNILCSKVGLLAYSGGGAYLNNIIYGAVQTGGDGRFTPYFNRNSTDIKGVSIVNYPDSIYMNNMFMDMPNNKGSQLALSIYDNCKRNGNLLDQDNAYFNSTPSKYCQKCYKSGEETGFSIKQDGGDVLVEFNVPESFVEYKAPILNSKDFRNTMVSEEPYLDNKGNYINFDRDFFGKLRTNSTTNIGPFSNLKAGKNTFKVWSFEK